MKRSRFTEEQIIGVLKEHQAGLSAKELCRKHGISDATFCGTALSGAFQSSNAPDASPHAMTKHQQAISASYISQPHASGPISLSARP